MMHGIKKLAMILAAALVASCGGGGATDGSANAGSLEAARKTPQGGPQSTSSSTSSGSTTTGTTTSGSGTSGTTTTTTGGTPLGVNLEGLADWSRLPVFVDMMKTSRKWGTADAPWDEAAATDASGWPTGDAGVVVRTDQADAFDSDGLAYQNLPSGTYQLAFTGRATVTPASSPGVTVANAAYDAATNRSTVDVVVGSGAYQLILSFRGTSGGVRDVSLMRPGYVATDTFTNEFKQALAPFGILRFMDYLATNNNPSRKWAERTTPASASQANARGGSYEYAIQMANELGKNIWINIPANADDDYITQLATLLNTKLAPGRVVYLEYSNELWNTIFTQNADNINAAVSQMLAGDTTITMGATCNTQALIDAGYNCDKYWASFRRVGQRISQISRIFSNVMGASAFNTRYRPVYATQWAIRAMGEQTLKYIAKYQGAPSSLVYGIAGAPYFNLPYASYTSSTLTVDQIISGLQASVDNDYAPYFKAGMNVNGVWSPGTAYNGGDWTQASQKALADYYGIKSIAYEGGLDLGQSDASGQAKMQANKDSRMGNIVTSELSQWFGCGNDVFLYYSVASPWNKWGYWGLTNNPGNLSLPRYVAAKQVAQTPAANFTTCR